MDAAIYSAVAARANRCCEACGGSGWPHPLEADHFFGRPPRIDETEFHVWLLCRSCHYGKTNNRPSAAHWYERFIAHCRKYCGDGYVAARITAEEKLAWKLSKGTTKLPGAA